jgi:hypothetical protein
VRTLAVALAALMFLVSQPVRSETSDDVTNRYKYRIEKTLYDLKAVQPDCPSCGLFTAGESSSYSPACRQTYKQFYKVKNRANQEKPEDSEVEIRLAFGYMDFLRDVDDYYAAVAFGTQVTNPCYRGQFACGFSQDPDDAGLFRKQIQLIGPDGLPRTRTVKLRMRYSSVSPDEHLNRGEKKAEQERRTARTRDFYADGLKHSDMVMYVGHARDGGGPDFGPPVVSEHTHRTDFDWYHRNHPGASLMHDALVSTATPPKIMGIYACYAEDHFYDQLRRDAPHAGLILSGNNEFEAAVGQAAASLDSVLGMRCEDDFKKSVNVIKKIDVQDMPGGFVVTPMKIDGVFKNQE